MPPIDENTILEVGKYYNVRCAFMKSDMFSMTYTIPILGEPHTDKQFGFKDSHFHIDTRFVIRRHLKTIEINAMGKTSHVCSMPPNHSTSHYVEKIVIERLVCKRLSIGIAQPAQKAKGVHQMPNARKYWKWYNSMIGKSCQGRKCPHFGTLMQEVDGRLVCPLHSLNGDLETEIIIPIK